MSANTKMEVDNNFITEVKNSLKECNTIHVLSLFQETKYQHDLENSSCDLIPVICEYLTENVKVNNPEIYICCEELINIVAEKVTPEKCLLQLIANVEDAKNDTAFISVLKPLQVVFTRVHTNRQKSLAWLLNVLKVYVEKLDVPDSQNLEGDQKMLMEVDPVTDRITRLYLELLSFYDALIANLEKDQKDLQECTKMILIKFLIQLLGKPFAYLNMEYDGRTRRIAENLCEKIMKLLKDPIILVDLKGKKDEDDVSLTPPFAQAVLFYLIFAEHLFIESIPKVYDPVYVFQTYLHLIPALCSENNQFHVEKALKLSSAFVESVKGLELSYQLLDSKSHCMFFKTLSNVILHNSSETKRKLALSIFKRYLDNFEICGKYLLIFNIVYTTPEHIDSHLIGYLITYYKNILNEALNREEENIPEYFTGQKLFNLLHLFCSLHKSKQRDLIECSDQIIASLNLLRYLAIRDDYNRTKIWHHFPILDERFFEPLKNCLLFARAHYKMKINEANEEIKTNRKSKADTYSISLTVGCENLSEEIPNEKLIELNSAMTALDVMESLLARLVELIDYYKIYFSQ